MKLLPDDRMSWPINRYINRYTTRIMQKKKKSRIFSPILGCGTPSFRKRFRRKLLPLSWHACYDFSTFVKWSLLIQLDRSTSENIVGGRCSLRSFMPSFIGYVSPPPAGGARFALSYSSEQKYVFDSIGDFRSDSQP